MQTRVFRTSQALGAAAAALAADAVRLAIAARGRARLIAVTPGVPASILRTHPATTLFLDAGSSAALASPTPFEEVA